MRNVEDLVLKKLKIIDFTEVQISPWNLNVSEGFSLKKQHFIRAGYDDEV